MSMYTLISIVIVLMVIIGRLIYYWKQPPVERTSYGYTDDYIETSIGVVGVLFVTLLLLGAGLKMASGSDEKETVTYRSEFTTITSLRDFTQDYSTASGSSFILVAHYQSESGELYNIRYVTKDENGVSRISTMEIDPLYVGFMEDGTEKLEVIYEEVTYSNDGDWRAELLDLEPYSPTSKAIDYIFHIPENSIQSTTELNLE